ncbi:hypothetical protein [Stenomitos frigidus]|uniref:Uncharacterized protein n=1 Tax=Stenomitos frigidus ULC18 TaxID=2107698 RepID=A0A2T1EHD5_9CYAN|nr:hypothetical protein [Stenomitos frigidus]PSB32166.1 hypothetical protein C7B82_05855 [Stenomitos frigidus ULC18]
MSKPCFCMGAAIACTSILANAAIALPLPSLPSGSTLRLDANAPVCYIQFQGSSTIDVSQVCGKTSGEMPANGTAVTVSSASAPPVFDPRVTNAFTTGQCNFVDANGNPCPQKQPQ